MYVRNYHCGSIRVAAPQHSCFNNICCCCCCCSVELKIIQGQLPVQRYTCCCRSCRHCSHKKLNSQTAKPQQPAGCQGHMLALQRLPLAVIAAAAAVAA
jgi:hypothetical protein